VAAAVVNLMVIAGQERRTARQNSLLFLFSQWIAQLDTIDAISPWQRLTPLVAAYLLNRHFVKICHF